MMQLDALKRLNECRYKRQFVFTTHSFNDDSTHVYTLDDAPSHMKEVALKAKEMGKGFTFTHEDKEFFINPYLPPLRIFVIGAVHIAQALDVMARECGYDVYIIDPREAFASPVRFSDHTVLSTQWPEEYFAQSPLDSSDALVALSHNPDIDDKAILHALEKNVFYIGALGSRKTHAGRIQRLLNKTAIEAGLAKIHAPIGLNISSVTPQEIAVSILAEIIQSWRGENH